MVGELVEMEGCKVIHIEGDIYMIVVYDKSLGKVFISRRIIGDNVNINEFITDFCLKAEKDFNTLDLTQDIIEY